MTNDLKHDPSGSLEQALQHIDSWMQLLTQRIQLLLTGSEETGKMKISERELALDRHVTLAKHLLSERLKYSMQLDNNKEQRREQLTQSLIDTAKSTTS